MALAVQERDTLYSKEKVISIIRNYQNNVRYVEEIKKESVSSVGVAQYGEEAAMPKAQGGKKSSDTENQVIRTEEILSKRAREIQSDMKYLLDRLHRIEDEKDAIIVHSVMHGKNYKEVADFLKCDASLITWRMNKIADVIRGEYL